jgi:import inner membrane translocase subunit TIM50
LDKLLPDPVHPAIQPKTLVLNLTGTLVKTHYIFGKGLSVEKRPGLEQLLRRMIRQYEIVIFSDDDSMMIETLLPSLDPRHEFLQWYFGKECMVLSGKKYIKDIKYLNRDPRRVIVIDRSKDIVPKNKDNVIVLKDFDGDQNDRALYQLIGLLDGTLWVI